MGIDMEDYSKRVSGGAQDYSQTVAGPEKEKEGVIFQRNTKEVAPQSNVRNAEKAENFQFTALHGRKAHKATVGQQLKMKLLWLGQKMLSGKARSWVTGQAIKLMNEAYQLNQPEVANHAHRLIRHHNLPMTPQQQRDFDQICQRLAGKVVTASALEMGAQARREGAPERTLEHLGGWFVSDMNTLMSVPLKSLSQIEGVSENELISQYCLALTDVMSGGNQAGLNLPAQKKLLLSMQNNSQFANNPSLRLALEQLANRGVS